MRVRGMHMCARVRPGFNFRERITLHMRACICNMHMRVPSCACAYACMRITYAGNNLLAPFPASGSTGCVALALDHSGRDGRGVVAETRRSSSGGLQTHTQKRKLICAAARKGACKLFSACFFAHVCVGAPTRDARERMPRICRLIMMPNVKTQMTRLTVALHQGASRKLSPFSCL